LSQAEDVSATAYSSGYDDEIITVELLHLALAKHLMSEGVTDRVATNGTLESDRLD